MKRSSLILFVAICLVAADLRPRASARAASKGTAVSEVQRLNRAPVNKEVLRVKLPSPRRRSSPTG